MTAVVTCGSCGTGLRQTAKFCDECGAPTAVSGDTAEYKQVTVLFADVVRSMDIATAMDPERWREIMTGLVERSAAVVRRYGGTVEHTGDGVMAIFGAPVALEDHAFRGCLAALAIQEEVNRLAGEVQRRDGVALRLRVGLNSGQVIAGAIGAGSLGYAATGEPVGLAQRMESVAPSGAVMLSEATARLVEHATVLGEPEWLRVKGVDEPVRARRLVSIGPRDGLVGRTEASLVGRRWEMAALDAVLDRTTAGRGAVVTVAGPPGIGKSRVAREAAALATGRGADVFWAFCESHARDVAFHAVTRLLRAGTGVTDLDDPAARARVREQVPDADPQDLLLLDDLLGIADPDVPLPQIDPDARRRRLTALINTASLARTQPALFLIEDAHWIDAASESLLTELLAATPRTPSMVLITYRPEYQGAPARMPGAQTIALAPLADSDTAALLGELLGSHPSVGELAAVIAERAAGNPFFAEEMVRELAQRGVLTGGRGGFDDTLFRRWGKRVHHAFWTHDGAAQGPAKLGRGNRWVIIGIVVTLPFCSHPVCLPMLFRLWAGKGTASPVELAGDMLVVLRKAFPHKRIHLVGDAAYHGRPLLVAGTTITTRLPANAALHAPAPPRTGHRGRPAKKGRRLPRLAELAATATWRTLTVHRYGRTDTVAIAVIDCLWYGPFGDTPGRAVLVREPDTDTGYNLALFTTDTVTGDSAAEHIVARYADRWP